MGDVKAKFNFVVEALDNETTVVKDKTIQLMGQPENFQFPRDEQTKDKHTELFDHPVTKGVVKSLKMRNKFRNVVITLRDDGYRDIYLEDEGNVVFNEYYLESVQAGSSSASSLPSKISSHEKPIHSIAKNMVLENINGNHYNAESWLNSFVIK
ncbi:hypothetical protein WA026_022989 [Henosepilachna vigintioctopunctata]|uniref:Uncharacterized protein n=1 Tax=Henosepilachna vigintioctopunctata TaxID=420089 RepID=A0AAW1UJ53_9CUCU